MAKPKYEQIKDYLKAEALKPEAATSLPSVRMLMCRFNVAMATVHQALIELEHENIIIRQQGRGIIAAREPQKVAFFQKTKDKPTILLAYPDYPSEQLWRLAFISEQLAKQSGFEVIPYKIYPNTTVQMLTGAVTHCPNCRELLLIPSIERYNYAELELLGSLSLPVVLLDCLFDYNELPDNLYMLGHDPILAGELLAECLLKNGHKLIGSIRNEPQSDYGSSKQAAFVKTVKKGGGKIPATHVFSETIRSWDNTLAVAQQITRKNLPTIRNLGITALVYTSTLGVFGAIPVLVEAGLRVPDDISLIGECDSTWYENANPPLTVLQPNFGELCQRAVEIAKGKFTDEHQFFCSQKIIPRKSVRKLN